MVAVLVVLVVAAVTLVVKVVLAAVEMVQQVEDLLMVQEHKPEVQTVVAVEVEVEKTLLPDNLEALVM